MLNIQNIRKSELVYIQKQGSLKINILVKN